MTTSSRFTGRALRILATGAAACVLMVAGGCVAKRGVTFGHWAMRSERINTVRIFVPESGAGFSGDEKLLLLPPLGDMPVDNVAQLQKHIHQEMLNYFRAPVYTISPDGRMKEYLDADNLLLHSGQFDIEEVSRLGELLGVSHVLCVLVRQFRPYPPQVLALSLVMVKTETREVAAEMDATFDASQQEVILAADQYLQTRLAREYSAQNLDILLRSPTQYSGFVSAYCCRILAQVLQQNMNGLRNETNEPIEQTESTTGPT